MLRTCKKCGETKEIEEFVRHKKCKEGYSYECIKCRKEYTHRYRQVNMATIRIKHNTYVKLHFERHKEIRMKYEKENRQKIRLREKEIRDKLNDSYITSLFPNKSCNNELIELKRIQIQLLRLTKKTENEKCN